MSDEMNDRAIDEVRVALALDAWPRAAAEPMDEMTLAAYLDGGLDELARERLEARLAGDSSALGLLCAARDALDAAQLGAPVPPGVLARAQGLVAPRPRRRAAGLGARFVALLDGALESLSPLPRPLAAGLAGLALLASSTTGFELGRSAFPDVAAESQRAEAVGEGLLDGFSTDLL